MLSLKRRHLLLLGLASLLTRPAWASGLTLSEAWVRGTVPGQTLSAAFMRIESRRAGMILAASSPVAREVRLVEMHSESRGPLQAKVVPHIPLALGMTQLSPVTHHLQLLGLKQPLNGGERISLSLSVEYSDGTREQVQVEAVARALAVPGTTKP